MATIPLPALHVQPPPDPMEGMSRMLALKQMIAMQPGQLELQHQQITAGQQQEQIRQQQVRDMQTVQGLAPKHVVKDSSGNVTGYDWEGLTADAASAGVRPETIERLQSAQKTGADTLLAKTNAQKAQLDLHQNINKQAYEKLEGLRGITDPAQRQAAWQSAVQWAQQNGAEMGQAPQTAPDNKGLDSVEAMLGMHAQAIADAKTQAETRKTTAEAGKAEAETQFSAGPLAEARYRFVLSKMAAKQPVSAEDMNFARGYEASNAKATSSSDSLGVVSSGTSRPAGLASVGAARGAAPAAVANPDAGPAQPTTPGSPAAAPQTAKDSLVDMIGQYKLNPGQMMRVTGKHPDVLAAVNSKYPDWNQPSYNAINHMITSYTSGPESKSINAISTAMGHGLELGKAIDALDNGDTGLKFLRDLGNKLNIQTGGDTVTTFNLIARRLAPEITAAYVQGGGGEGERVANAGDFDASLGGKQLRSNLSKTIQLLGSKIAAQEQQWNTTVHPTTQANQFRERFLTPLAKEAIAKYGSAGEAGSGAKLLSMDQIQQAAKDHGVSIDEAKRQAQAAGYQIK